MEINPIILALSIHGRIYCGLDAEEALAVAEQTVELAMADNEADIVDLLDMFDDVWAASLLAGTIHDESTIPEHPLDNKTRVLNNAADPEEYEMLALLPEENFGVKTKPPKRYKDPKFVAVKKNKKKRRKWDKGGE
jgi:hypothetical protein